MAQWAKPEYTKKQVDAAGQSLASQQFPILDDAALAKINNWRSSHSYPLNTFQTTLRNKAKKIEHEIIVAQRIKRLESIHRKLSRFEGMQLSRMQDIAGCRVVFKDIASVDELVANYKRSDFDHVLAGEKDYIAEPKPDGYRCHHLVYSYKSRSTATVYDGKRIEVQIRTQLQHAWATAVESVGIFTNQALKSNQGDADWIRFFALMGSAIAAIEGCNPVPDTPIDKVTLISEISALAVKLRVLDSLTTYRATIRESKNLSYRSKYFLLQLTPESGISVYAFKASESEQANQAYTELESSLPEGSPDQVVLVSVDSISALMRAYPNYFADTQLFSGILKRVMEGKIPDPLPHPVKTEEQVSQK